MNLVRVQISPLKCGEGVDGHYGRDPSRIDNTGDDPSSRKITMTRRGHSHLVLSLFNYSSFNSIARKLIEQFTDNFRHQSNVHQHHFI